MSITVTKNFVGVTAPAGATSNKATHADSPNPPTSPPTGTEADNTAYTNISSANGTDWNTTSSSGSRDCHFLRFYVPESNLISFVLAHTGWGHGTKAGDNYGRTIFIWNNSGTPAWESIGTEALNSSNTLLTSSTVSTNINNYRNGSNYVYIAVLGAGSNDGTGDMHTDYVKLDVTYNTGILDQKHGQLYNDDGSTVNNCTSLASEDANYYLLEVGVNFIARYEIANTGSAAINVIRRFEVQEDAGAWTQASTSSGNLRLVSSSHFSDGDATTQRQTPVGTFTPGQGKYSGSDTSSISLTNAYNVEDQWCLQLQAGAAGHIYHVRVSNAGTPLDTYSQTLIIAPVSWRDTGSLFTPGATTTTHILHGTIKTGSATYPACMRVYDITAGAAISGSKISTTGTSFTEISSGALTLTAAHQLKTQIGIAKGGTVTPVNTAEAYTP